MTKISKILALTAASLILFFGVFSYVGAQSNEDKLAELNKQIEEYQNEINRLQSQANTLSNQIAQFDAQIQITQLKIEQTKEKILLLGGRIDQLEDSLGSLSDAFSSRAVETYKMTRFGDSLFFLLSSHDLSDAVSRYQYLKTIQEADRGLLVRLQKAQNSYVAEKTDQEELHTELEDQQQVLGAQKTAKATLLTSTKNDEAKYQQLLAKARAEIEAISAIIAGKGQENEVGGVSTGERVASIIPGASACSSGGHLHLEVVKGGAHNNPAGFLSPKGVIWDNSPDGPITFTGSWPWPLNDPIRVTQGYGMTYYAATLKYYGGAPHTGIDMVNNNNDSTVKAVQSGTLYRGAIGCGGGTLRYVRVAQSEGIDTYYLHVNY